MDSQLQIALFARDYLVFRPQPPLRSEPIGCKLGRDPRCTLIVWKSGYLESGYLVKTNSIEVPLWIPPIAVVDLGRSHERLVRIDDLTPG